MKLVIDIEMDNAAFEGGDPLIEASRIIRELIDGDLHEMLAGDAWNLRDINRNRVGKVTVE